MKNSMIQIIAFFTGFSMMGFEILASRVLAPHFGSSVYVWGALISVFLFGLSIGYFIGGKLVDKEMKYKTIVLFLLLAVISYFMVSVIGSYICMFFSNIISDVRYAALLASTVLFIIPCICLGSISPMLIKLSIDKHHEIGNKIGLVYFISTIGSIVGILFVSFYLIAWIGTINGIKLLCIPLLISSVLAFILNQKFKENN